MFSLKFETKKYQGRKVLGISLQVCTVILEETHSSSFYIDWKEKVRLVDQVQMVVPVPVIFLCNFAELFS